MFKHPQARVLMASAIAIALSPMVTASVSADLVNDTNFTETEWLDVPGNITGMAFAPDGSNRLFLIHKTGEVRIVRINPGGSGTLLPTPFATVAPIFTNSECGLIGMTFDPDFVTNGYVYFFVTVSSSEQQIIRYTASGDTGTSKTTIVEDLPTVGNNHDGGGLGVGADGMLYWGIGDLGNGTGVDGDLSSMAAKIGRARRDGSIPGDNPFVDGPGGNADYLFARGFRNPFTLTFQPSTGLLWVNVVGTGFEQVFVVRSGDHAGYNDYENDQPTGYITPTLVYRTGGSRVLNFTATGAVRTAGVTTFTTTVSHRLRQGERVVVTGVADNSFNGTFYVTDGSASPGDSTFTVANPGPNASSGDGDARTMAQGRAVSGGTFYDATGFPAEYRGNFFYGDFVDDRTMRAAVGPGTTVRSVDYWSNSQLAPIDQAVGPDGALYTAGYGGRIYRARYDSPTQGLVVSQQHVRIMEGGAGAWSVSLARMPASAVTVNVNRTAGDADVNVSSGSALTFTTTNWMDPQPVRIAAAADSDGEPDQATMQVTSSGLSSVDVTVNVTDTASLILMASVDTLSVPETEARTFTVRLADAPTGNVTVSVSRTAGDADVRVSSGGALTFTPVNFAAPQTVTITGDADIDSIDDTATITVEANGAETRNVAVRVVDSTALPMDGGVDAGTMSDGGTADAGMTPSSGGGCGCHVVGGSESDGGWLGFLVVAALLSRTRWRRR